VEAGEELLADAKAATSDELSLQERVADFDAFFVRIDDPAIRVPLAKQCFTEGSRGRGRPRPFL
jgi:hypothetical protein